MLTSLGNVHADGPTLQLRHTPIQRLLQAILSLEFRIPKTLGLTLRVLDDPHANRVEIIEESSHLVFNIRLKREVTNESGERGHGGEGEFFALDRGTGKRGLTRASVGEGFKVSGVAPLETRSRLLARGGYGPLLDEMGR